MALRNVAHRRHIGSLVCVGLVGLALAACGSSSGSSPPVADPALCGNGQLDPGERCDGAVLGEATCASQTAFDGGDLSCNATCDGYDTSGCHSCGNGTVEGLEECDGLVQAGTACATLGEPFTGGELSCDPLTCRYDTRGCEYCGNGTIGPGEDCDELALGGHDCSSVPGDFLGGTLACHADTCTFDTSGCNRCGNGAIDPGEDCDGGDLGEADCTTIPGAYGGGTLGCDDKTCTYVTTACTLCGNGVLDPGEACDGTDFGSATCATVPGGFGGGTLACTPGCEIDATGCTLCGNGVLDPGEDCDGTTLGTADCTELGTFSGGTVACDAANCRYDLTGCVGCGNGTREGPEACDGDDFGGADCTTVVGTGANGSLACTATCDIDISGCTLCGNSAVDPGEDCDGAALADNDCTTLGLGFAGGTLGCDAGCRFDTTQCLHCGNGTIDPGEECDGAALGGNDCTTAPGNFAGGLLACDAGCRFVTSGCLTCGNGVIDLGEACDGEDVGGLDCRSIPGGYVGGALTCDDTCNLVTSACRLCGNGVIDPGEACDGADLGGNGCAEVPGGFTGGTLACNERCAFVTTACHKCGNGFVDATLGEDCDGTALGGNDCATVPGGFSGGTLACDAGCRFDVAACHKCGNGAVDADYGEACDGPALGGNDCTTVPGGFGGGTLACNAQCDFDTTACHRCGNGTVDPGEACDGAALGGNDCTTVPGGFTGGTLACTEACELTTAACHKCGNGQIDADMGETCDGEALGGNDCTTLPGGFTGGTLACDETCHFATVQCHKCGNGVVDPAFGETCDGEALGGNDCTTVPGGFAGGTLGCDETCHFATAQCHKCGNGVVDPEFGETCDGEALGGNDCTTVPGGFAGGTLACDGNCQLTTAQCHKCGNGVVDPEFGETCDGEALGGNDCTTVPGDFVGGTLACDGACQFTTAACHKCGNGVVDPEFGETCDGAALGGNDCSTVPGDFVGGTLACDGACQFTTAACHKCGNGQVDPEFGESCDGPALGGNDCTTVPGDFVGGTLGCDGACQFATTACHKCGNGQVDAGEQCDGPALGGNDCTTVPGGFFGGVLGCDAACLFEVAGCHKCGNGVTDPDLGEECDDANESDHDACLGSCLAARCGDGIVWDEAGGDEGCDDGLQNSDTRPNACRTNCVPAHCGDGVFDGGERCEPGAPVGDHCCSRTCRFTPENGADPQGVCLAMSSGTDLYVCDGHGECQLLPEEEWVPTDEPDGLPGPIPGVYDDQGSADPQAGFRALMGFPMRNRTTLAERLVRMYDPTDEQFRQYMTTEEWNVNHAPRQEDFDLVKAWLLGQGMQVNYEASNRLLLQFSGTVEQFNTTFETDLHVLLRENPQQGNPPFDVYGTLETFTLPAFVAERSTGVITCDLPVDPGPLPGEAGDIVVQPPDPNWGRTLSQIARAYDIDDLYAQGHRGQGVTLGIVVGAMFKFKDLQSFWQSMGVTRANPTVVYTMENPATRYLETTLDTEWAGGLAPEAELVVYAGPDARNTSMVFNWNEAIARGEADILTSSFAHREDSEPMRVRHQYSDSAMMGAALGITLMAASGDTQRPDTPSSSPYVTAVGGTSLSVDYFGNVLDESVWSGSGSGVTRTFALPYWQEGIVTDSNGLRAVVDVACASAAGSGYWVYYLGNWSRWGGTSFASPVFAGLMAVVNSARLAEGLPRAGFLNPLLYLDESVRATFRDVTAGGTSYYSAGPGWDYPTGWGAPSASGLAGTLP